MLINCTRRNGYGKLNLTHSIFIAVREGGIQEKAKIVTIPHGAIVEVKIELRPLCESNGARVNLKEYQTLDKPPKIISKSKDSLIVDAHSLDFAGVRCSRATNES